MKFKTYIENEIENTLYEYILLVSYLDKLNCLNEMTIANIEITKETMFKKIQNLGKKLGLKVSKTDTFFTYLSRANQNMQDLITLICLYIMSPQKQKDEIKDDIKNILNNINKREIANFFLMVDRSFLGLSSIIRNTLMNVFGVEISTYKRWQPDLEFIFSKLKEIKIVLDRIGPTKEELETLQAFKNSIKKALHESIVTGDVAKVKPRLDKPVRRKRKLKNKLLGV